MLLRDLQNLLARVYGIDVNADVSDFLVTNQKLLSVLSGKPTRSVDETLFIMEDGDTLDIALYLDSALLQRLTAANPCDDLRQTNLDDFCKVLEGVSHFLYVAWNALNDKCVTRLELELQAEVDKYVSTRLLLEMQSEPAKVIPQLLDKLFMDVRYRDDLGADERGRYRQANGMGSRYCCNLAQRFPAGFMSAPVQQELRAFYRMPQREKFSHIHSVQFAW